MRVVLVVLNTLGGWGRGRSQGCFFKLFLSVETAHIGGAVRCATNKEKRVDK